MSDPTPTPTPAPVWHEGIDSGLIGVAQLKGWKLDNPKEAFAAATKAYQDAQKLIGVPENELIRMPKANAAEADVKVFLGKLGVPAEAKEYDLSTVKRADGRELDVSFADTMRAALFEARVPKDRAAAAVAGVVKFMDGQETATKAEVTTAVKAEMDALKTNWNKNFDLNQQLAKSSLEKLGQAAGLTPEQTQKGWDALSKVGGIGASYAMEMLLTISKRMGEAPFVGPNQGGPDQPLSQAAAKAEIDMLKKDTAFAGRLLAGDRESRRRWDQLHALAFPRQQVA